MIQRETYRSREIKEQHLKRIKAIEAKMIDQKIKATGKDGGYTYDFIMMMNTTRHLLDITKSLEEDENPIPPFPDDDLTVGDM
jgi:hypothetical protein